MDAAYLFGNAGNISTALGAGWSMEDGFAWAIGAESELTLPLDRDDAIYTLRFDLHPALFPPKVPHQRLMIRAGKIVLGSFELTERQTLAVAVPQEVTAGAGRLILTLIHPDAARPRDHLPVDDSRRLAICFHSASLTRSEADPSQAAAARAGLEPVHGIIAGGAVARRIAQVIERLPSLKGRFGLRFVDLSKPLHQAAARLQPEALDTAQFCWLELNGGTPVMRDLVRQGLSGDCVLRTYYAPICRSLWPFEAADDRAVAEPGRYVPARYPYGDRLARALVGLSMPDDVLYLMYDMSADQDPLELDEIFAYDLRRWQAEGKKSDIQLAGFIQQHLITSRIFSASNSPGALLLREMVRQLLDDELVHGIASPEQLAGELDTLLDGYAGWPEEVPVHKRVAAHFNLTWWSADLKYRWWNNLRSHRAYILDYIKWVQWRT